MLVTCPECQQQVSDKALTCPHCGFPLQSQKKTALTPKPRKHNKRRRLPNGFGQIAEIKNRNLRRPFRAMVTVGKTDEGKPICKPLQPQAYFETYNDAYLALMNFNKNPFDLTDRTTMQEIYDKWYSQQEGKVHEGTLARYRISWAYSEAIHAKPIREVRIADLRNCIEYGTIVRNGKTMHPKFTSIDAMKTLYNHLYDYAVEHEIVDHNIARQFTVSSGYIRTIPRHIPYTDEEIALLWDNIEKYPGIDMILIQCYSGWRPQELCNLCLSDVDISAGTMKGGLKTSAGKNRIVPIHPRILQLIQARYQRSVELGSPYLFSAVVRKEVRQISYDQFWTYHHNTVIGLALNPKHRPHDGRKHFVTMAKKYNLDEYAIKRIVGHYISDLTERIYTERSISWLKAEIEKIP